MLWLCLTQRAKQRSKTGNEKSHVLHLNLLLSKQVVQTSLNGLPSQTNPLPVPHSESVAEQGQQKEKIAKEEATA